MSDRLIVPLNVLAVNGKIEISLFYRNTIFIPKTDPGRDKMVGTFIG
jgi:hypothetical protein